MIITARRTVVRRRLCFQFVCSQGGGTCSSKFCHQMSYCPRGVPSSECSEFLEFLGGGVLSGWQVRCQIQSQVRWRVPSSSNSGVTSGGGSGSNTTGVPPQKKKISTKNLTKKIDKIAGGGGTPLEVTQEDCLLIIIIFICSLRSSLHRSLFRNNFYSTINTLRNRFILSLLTICLGN